MSVIFNSFDVIEIDGIAAGNIVDVVSNHAPRRAEVLAAFGVYVAGLQTEINAEKVALEAEKTQLTTDLATRTSERDSLQTQVTALESEKQELNSRIADLDTALDDEQQLTKQLQTKIADLEQYRPYNPRILKGEAFYDRVSKEDMVTLLTSEDPQLVLVGKTIDAYRDNKWPVILDSTDFQQLVGYVLASAVFNQAEVDAVMKDATREEAYT
jgi:predicted nuclease with TOPRIM domain